MCVTIVRIFSWLFYFFAGIDCDQAKQIEEKLMLEDAKRWLRSDASEADRPHPKTGATALHVAAAKGYTKVLSLLLAGRADVDKQDNDGWTPLHAASHWGQKEAVQMIVASMADMDILNYAVTFLCGTLKYSRTLFNKNFHFRVSHALMSPKMILCPCWKSYARTINELNEGQLVILELVAMEITWIAMQRHHRKSFGSK